MKKDGKCFIHRFNLYDYRPPRQHVNIWPGSSKTFCPDLVVLSPIETTVSFSQLHSVPRRRTSAAADLASHHSVTIVYPELSTFSLFFSPSTSPVDCVLKRPAIKSSGWRISHANLSVIPWFSSFLIPLGVPYDWLPEPLFNLLSLFQSLCIQSLFFSTPPIELTWPDRRPGYFFFIITLLPQLTVDVAQ